MSILDVIDTSQIRELTRDGSYSTAGKVVDGGYPDRSRPTNGGVPPNADLSSPGARSKCGGGCGGTDHNKLKSSTTVS